MFVIGKEYTRDDIHSEVGGSKQSYLPTLGGTVVAACLTKDLNPRAPDVVLCGRGKMIEPAGAALADQRQSIPVFVKLGVNRWEFHGMFRVNGSVTSGPLFGECLQGSGRSSTDVSRAVLLQRV
jgi:hypothetical protein